MRCTACCVNFGTRTRSPHARTTCCKGCETCRPWPWSTLRSSLRLCSRPRWMTAPSPSTSPGPPPPLLLCHSTPAWGPDRSPPPWTCQVPVGVPLPDFSRFDPSCRKLREVCSRQGSKSVDWGVKIWTPCVNNVSNQFLNWLVLSALINNIWGKWVPLVCHSLWEKIDSGAFPDVICFWRSFGYTEQWNMRWKLL